MRLIILPAIFAIAFLAFSFNTASAEITSTYSAYDWETGQTSLFYYDSNYNEITDPVQIVAYQYVQTTNPNADQSEILNLLQSGDLIVNPETATYTFVAQNEYDYSVPPVPIVPATLKGIEAIPDTQIAAQLFGPHYTEEVIQQIKAAAAGRGVSDSQIMTAAQQQLQAHQQKFGSGYTESSNEIDTAADIMVRLGLPDIRQAPGGQEARQQAIQAAEERWRATQDDDGGFFGGFFDSVASAFSDAVDFIACAGQDTIHAVGLRENGCGGGGGGDGGGGAAFSLIQPLPPACPPGYTGVPPYCAPTIGQSCSYNGSVPWGSGCSGSYSGTVDDGASVTVQNTASGYTGSASFTCSDGDWVGGSSSCNAVSPAQDCSYNGSVSWGSGCSGSYSGTVHSGESVTITSDASCRTGSTSFICSNGNWITTGSPTCQASLIPLSCLMGTATWSGWSACSGTCGGGSGTQTRTCSTGNSADCSGESSRTCTNNTVCTTTTPDSNNNDTGTGSTSGDTDTTTTLAPTPSCTPDTLCSGSDVYSRSSSCVDTLVESCDYGCSGGQCDAPPPISFSSFSATNLSGPFTATGHLQMRPTLVRQGDPTWLYWNVNNARSCTVSGTNSDSWSGRSSGASGKTTSSIQGQTTYTLHCTSLPGATPPSITESQVVNVVPVFREK